MIVKKGFDFDWPAFQCANIAKGEGVKLSRDICLGFTETSLAKVDRASSLANPTSHLIIFQFLE